MSRLVRCGAVTWHVQEMGDGPGLLLVHGAGSSADSFRALMPLLAPRFRVVAVDLPGHARTRVSRAFTPDLPSIAGALGDLVASLKLAPQTVVGHSAGAAVVTRMTLDGAIHPELVVGLAAALVPFEGAAGLLFPSAARLLGASRFAPRLLARAVSARSMVDRIIESTGSRLDEPSREHYRRLASQPAHVGGVLSMLAQWELAPLQRALPRLKTPVLLIAGDADLAVPLAQQRAIARVLPDARLVVVHGAGHLIHEEVPQRVATLAQNDDKQG